jgi:hypothetical protein
MLTQKITNHDEAYRVAIVASELMENVCRYSTGGTASIVVEQGKNREDIVVSIKNITKNENIEGFKKIFAMISSGSALEAYKNMMLRIIDNKDNTISQLGLARIRYEGRSELSYEIESDIESLTEGKTILNEDNRLLVLCVRSKMSIQPKDNGETHEV